MRPGFSQHLVAQQVGIAMQRNGLQAPQLRQPVGRRRLEQHATADFRRQIARHFKRFQRKR